MRRVASAISYLALLTVSSATCGCGQKSPTKVTHGEHWRPDEVLRISSKSVSIAGTERVSALINGTHPGPALRFKEGETKWIRVYNDMDHANTTIHWHGLTQAAFPFSDGTPMASQWPIPPKHFFDYQVRFPKGHAGTYFYHSHVGFQAITAGGSLIIEDAKTPYEYDDERIIMIGDLYNKTDEAMERDLKASPFIFGGEANAVLVNGKGVSNDPTPGAEDSAGPAIISVEPAKTYRFRWIGGTAINFVSAGIQDHDDLAVIEVDGDYTKEQNISFMQIGAGQRFSTLLRTKSCDDLAKENKSQYYLQVEPRERPNAANITGYAIIDYKTDSCKDLKPATKLSTKSYPDSRPVRLPPTERGWLDYKLEPIKDNHFPSAAEVTRRVHMDVHQFFNSHVTWAQNNVSWYEDLPTIPKTPYLISLYNNATRFLPDWDRAMANGGVDNQTLAWPAQIGEVLEIVIQNTGSDKGGLNAHPYHMHGAHVHYLASGPGRYNAEETEKRLKGTRPIRRDTMMLYKYSDTTTPGDPAAGWVAFRVRVQDPGVFMLHCHILQHMIMGMSTAWVFGNASEILTVPKPMVDGYLTFGGSVMGNSDRWPTVVDFEAPGDKRD